MGINKTSTTFIDRTPSNQKDPTIFNSLETPQSDDEEITELKDFDPFCFAPVLICDTCHAYADGDVIEGDYCTEPLVDGTSQCTGRYMEKTIS